MTEEGKVHRCSQQHLQIQKRQNSSLCSCLYKLPAGCFERELECLFQTVHTLLPAFKRWALNRHEKKKHTLWIRLRFYSVRMKYLHGEFWKVNFGSVYLRSGCFSLLKTVGQVHPSIPTASGLVNPARCGKLVAEVSSFKNIGEAYSWFLLI